MQGWMRYHFFESKTNDIQNCDFSAYNCACSFHGNLVFGDDSGYLTFLNNPTSDLNPIQFFDLPIKKIISLSEIPALLILASNTTNSAILLANPEINEIYSTLEFRDQKFVDPHFLTILNDASFLAFTPDYHTIQIYKVPKIGSKHKSITKHKEFVLNQKITNLHFAKDNEGTIALYYTTDSSVGSFTMQKSIFQQNIFEQIPISTDLSCVVNNGRLAICSGTKVSFYTPNGIDMKFPSIELDSSPTKIVWYREYLIGFFNSRSDSLRIYQLDTHCVFGVSKFGNQSQFLLFEWGSVILTRIPSKLTILNEFTTEQKVNLLCSQSKQFEVALKLSKMHRMSDEIVSEIHRQLGDTRYEKRDFDGAVCEYIESIGFLEPSYVINLFLEPQHAEYLVKYLEALHDKGLEDSRHTTLRFNCYTKLRRTNMIDKIVEQCVSNNKEPSFDVDAAVEVLKQGGYIEQATKIALAFDSHLTYCSIMDSIDKYDKIFEQMKVMPPKILKYAIETYGMKIMHAFDENQRNIFTDYISDVCMKNNIKPDLIKNIFCDFPNYELSFITKIVNNKDSMMNENLWNRFLFLTLIEKPLSILDTIKLCRHRYDDEAALLAINLKKCETKNDNQLQEILLKSLSIIYEHQKCYREILNISSVNDYVNICRKYENEDPLIWTEALQKAIESDSVDGCRQMLRICLKEEKVRLNEALRMMKSPRSIATLDMFIDLSVEQFSKLTDEINRKTEILENLSNEVEEKFKKSKKIENEIVSYRKGIHCGFCKERITLPAKFFKCGHVFHMHCLGDETDFCMKCREENELMAMKKVDELNEREKQTPILETMSMSNDGIGILEEVLKTGIMMNEPLPDEESEIRNFFKRFNTLEEDE